MESETGTPDGSVIVAVTAEAENVAGYQANLSFDPEVVQFENSSEADFDPVINANNEEGWITFTDSSASGLEDPTLAVLQFEVVGEVGDESPLRFVESETMLNDEELTEYWAEEGELRLQHGEIQVSEIGSHEGNGDETGSEGGEEGDQSGTADTQSGEEQSDSQSSQENVQQPSEPEGDDSDTSALLLLGAGFGAGILVVIFGVGIFMYGLRRGRQQVANEE